jgi:hypothetical protein
VIDSDVISAVLAVSAAVVSAAVLVDVVPVSADMLACELVIVASLVVMPTVDDSVVSTVELVFSVVAGVGNPVDVAVLDLIVVILVVISTVLADSVTDGLVLVPVAISAVDDFVVIKVVLVVSGSVGIDADIDVPASLVDSSVLVDSVDVMLISVVLLVWLGASVEIV